MKKEPFWKSTKKTLGVISTLCYWGIQVYVVKTDVNLIVPFIMPDVLLIASFLALKKINFEKKDKVNE